ncbi:hypothetical protein D9M69_704630 [compost metagenome]
MRVLFAHPGDLLYVGCDIGASTALLFRSVSNAINLPVGCRNGLARSAHDQLQGAEVIERRDERLMARFQGQSNGFRPCTEYACNFLDVHSGVGRVLSESSHLVRNHGKTSP